MDFPTEIELEVTEQDIAKALELRTEYGKLKLIPDINEKLYARSQFIREQGEYSSWCVLGQAARKMFPGCTVNAGGELELEIYCHTVVTNYKPATEQDEAVFQRMIDDFDNDSDYFVPAKIKLVAFNPSDDSDA